MTCTRTFGSLALLAVLAATTSCFTHVGDLDLNEENSAYVFHLEPHMGNVVFGTGADIELTLELVAGHQSLVGDLNVTLASGRGGDTIIPNSVTLGVNDRRDVVLHVTSPGEASVTASAPLATQTVAMEVANVDPSKSTLTFADSQLTVGDESLWGIFSAEDAKGRRLAGVAIEVLVDSPNAVVLPAKVVTQRLGQAPFAIRATTAGPAKLEASNDVVRFDETLDIVPAGIDVLRSVVQLTPKEQRADGQTPVAVTVQVVDAFDNPIRFLAVKLSASSARADLAATRGTTDGDGRFVTTLTSRDARLITVTAGLTPVSTSTVEIRGTVMFVAP